MATQATSLERQIAERLAAARVRFTQARRLVVRALADADGPLSAAELDRVLGGAVPLSSLYRSLSVLEEAGVLEPHLGARDVTRHELAEWLTGHHHHVVCVTCGDVADVTLPAALEAELEAILTKAATDAGFAASGHTVEIDGTCRACV